jgi:hypothetical protein
MDSALSYFCRSQIIFSDISVEWLLFISPWFIIQCYLRSYVLISPVHIFHTFLYSYVMISVIGSTHSFNIRHFLFLRQNMLMYCYYWLLNISSRNCLFMFLCSHVQITRNWMWLRGNQYLFLLPLSLCPSIHHQSSHSLTHQVSDNGRVVTNSGRSDASWAITVSKEVDDVRKTRRNCTRVSQ